MDLTITRQGEVITIFPKRQNLREAVEILRAKPSSVEERELIETSSAGYMIGTNIAIRARDGVDALLQRLVEHDGAVVLSALSLAELKRGL